MDQIDRLTTLSKQLYDHRITGQRQEIEALKKESIKNHYLYMEVCHGGYNSFTCIIPASTESEVIQKISEIKSFKECYDDENYELERDNQPKWPSIIEYIKRKIEYKEIFIAKLDEILLGTGRLYADPKHEKGEIVKGI